MSLDQNLFTLLFTPNQDNPNVVDLIDPSGNVHYRKRRVMGSVYTAEVYGVLSESSRALMRLSGDVFKTQCPSPC